MTANIVDVYIVNTGFFPHHREINCFAVPFDQSHVTRTLDKVVYFENNLVRTLPITHIGHVYRHCGSISGFYERWHYY